MGNKKEHLRKIGSQLQDWAVKLGMPVTYQTGTELIRQEERLDLHPIEMGAALFIDTVVNGIVLAGVALGRNELLALTGGAALKSASYLGSSYITGRILPPELR